MLKRLKNNYAQAILGEYAVVIFLVITVIVAMTIYFKRAVQARIHDARDHMVSEVRTRTAGEFNGVLYKEYEPYYTNTAATASSSADQTTQILPGQTSGLFKKQTDETRTIQSTSETLPPREFDATTPTN